MQEWISSPIGMHPVESGQWVLAADAYAERDRLAVENAELLQACDDFSKELSVQYQLELEAKCHDDLEESHAIMVQVVAERDAELAAAGPWRTDVENAPKDGSEVLLAWRDCIGEPHCESFHWDADDNVWINGDGGFVEDSGIRAFATINRPEIEG